VVVSDKYEHFKSLLIFYVFLYVGKPTTILSDYDDYLLPSEFDIGDSSSSHKENTKMVRSDTDTESVTGDSILEEEEREEGSVQINVYMSYLRAIGYLLSGAILLSMFLMQSSRNITDWWLSYWVSTYIYVCSMVSYKFSVGLGKCVMSRVFMFIIVVPDSFRIVAGFWQAVIKPSFLL
jgi:ATP-binding cassette subfamily C (CFTR/MRP) protein 10